MFAAGATRSLCVGRWRGGGRASSGSLLSKEFCTGYGRDYRGDLLNKIPSSVGAHLLSPLFPRAHATRIAEPADYLTIPQEVPSCRGQFTLRNKNVIVLGSERVKSRQHESEQQSEKP